MCTLIEELCASSEDQETAGVVPSASQHRAVLLPGKRETVWCAPTGQSPEEGKEAASTVKDAMLEYT